MWSRRRYALIRDAADPGLSKAERGRLVGALERREHVGPDGQPVRVSARPRWTGGSAPGAAAGLTRWSAAAGGGAAHAAELLELAVALKRERPDRTAAQVAAIMLAAAVARRGADDADPFRAPGADAAARGRPSSGKV